MPDDPQKQLQLIQTHWPLQTAEMAGVQRVEASKCVVVVRNPYNIFNDLAQSIGLGSQKLQAKVVVSETEEDHEESLRVHWESFAEQMAQ